MCGICGIWEYGAAEGRVERALVERMRDVMTPEPVTLLADEAGWAGRH